MPLTLEETTEVRQDRRMRPCASRVGPDIRTIPSMTVHSQTAGTMNSPMKKMMRKAPSSCVKPMAM